MPGDETTAPKRADDPRLNEPKGHPNRDPRRDANGEPSQRVQTKTTNPNEQAARALKTAMRDGSGRPRPDAINPNRLQQQRPAGPPEYTDQNGQARPERRRPVLSARDVVQPQTGELDGEDAVERQPNQGPRGDPRQNRPSMRPASAGTTREIRSRIKNLEFVDMYLPMNPNSVARYNPKNVRLGEPGNVPVGKDYYGDLAALRDQLQNIAKEDFSVVHDDVRYRGSKANLANGEKWVCLRRISGDVPTLENLRIDPVLLPRMRDLGRRNGLVIVCGGTGQGKSTTATALLADYLDRIGHVAMTIEDPVEFNMHGERGNGGYCFQVEVDDEEAWAPALKRALRWHPKYILVGEIRSGAAAAQVLRAATSGHLVIATFHAGSIEKGIQSIIQVAESEIGVRAQDLVAEGLAAAFHQTITPSGPEISYLFTDPSGADPARQYIRSGKLHMLNSYMEQQAVRMANEAAGRNPDGSTGRQ